MTLHGENEEKHGGFGVDLNYVVFLWDETILKSDLYISVCSGYVGIMNGSNTKDAFPFSRGHCACARVGQWQVSLRILQQMAVPSGAVWVAHMGQ